MQAINDTVRNPVFAAAFFGALISLPLAALLHRPRRSPRTMLLTAAAQLYVVGGFAVTFAANVPLNDRLATVDLASVSAAQISEARAGYEGTSNAYNDVRTIACTLALSASSPPPSPRMRRARCAGA